MGTHLNGGQAAAVHVLAVMGAAGDAAIDGAVRGAFAAVIGAVALLIVAHCRILPKNKSQAVRPDFIVYRFGGIIRPKAILQRQNK